MSMPHVIEQVDRTYLLQPSPRPLPLGISFRLLLVNLLARPLSVLLDPLLLLSLAVLIALTLFGAPVVLWVVPVFIVLVRLLAAAAHTFQRVWDDLSLLRNGKILRAHVLKVRPYRDTSGTIQGVLLDCAIPISPRRTHIGSVWLSDGVEALKLAQLGRVEVVCLTRAPGTWRVIEDVRSEVRYERMGTMPDIPHID